MKPLVTQVKDNAGLLGILATLLVVAGSFSQLEKLAWLIHAPSVAYAGQATAEDTKEKFERYIERQEAFTEALQEYTKQNQQAQGQMPNQAAPQRQAPVIQNFIEWDERNTCWQCQGVYDYEECWDQKLWRVCDPETNGM